MLLNILHPALSSTVACESVATENYEASNLLSADKQKSQLGFLAYSCVKPPVELSFSFACAFNIQYIVLWPVVASQKSVGFVILTEKDSLLTVVGSGYLCNEPGVLFYRNDVYSKQKIEDIPVPKTFYKATLRNVNNQLSDCTNVTVRITKTANSSAPAISKLEIWGSVSHSCSKDIRSNIHNIWSDKVLLKNVTNTMKQCEKMQINHLEEHVLVPQNKIEVPEEFLDLITYNIMVIPLVLPSGKVIDQSTLDEHTKHEATWGRPPSDPFTGLPFTRYRKPFVSFALKGKIEKFLLENSGKRELFNVPRVSGHFVANNTGVNNPDKHEHNKPISSCNESSTVDRKIESNKTSRIKVTEQYKNLVPQTRAHRFKKIDRGCLVIKACFECSVSERLLKISCGHFICRMCIHKLKDLTCRLCQTKFTKADVTTCL